LYGPRLEFCVRQVAGSSSRSYVAPGAKTFRSNDLQKLDFVEPLASRVACGSKQPQGPFPPAAGAPGKPWTCWYPGHRRCGGRLPRHRPSAISPPSAARRAGLFPFQSSVSSCSRSALLSLTTYFFTEISVQTIMRPIAHGRDASESQNLNPCKLIEPGNYDAPIADRGVSVKGLHLHTASAQRTTTRIAERSLEF
jgi:hypothetical protein